MQQIGQFSRLSGLSIETLRHYDHLGILRPARVDPVTGYRQYDLAQLQEANRILALKDAGFSLAQIAQIQRRRLGTPQLLELLQRQADRLRAELDQAQQRLDRLLSSIFLIQNGGIPMANQVIVKSVEPITVCSLRRCIPREQFDPQLEEMWPAVNAHIDRHGVRRSMPCLMLYYDGTWSFAGDTLDIEVAEPVAAQLPGGEDIEVHDLPAVPRMASIVHRGPFATIRGAYEALFSWVTHNGYKTDGPLREIYHVGDWATSDTQQYVTELQIPLA